MKLMQELTLSTIEALLNQALAHDLNWTTLAKPLDQQRIRFHLETIDYDVLMQVSNAWISLSLDADTPADLTIHATPKACMEALRDKALPRSIKISGDAFLAQHLQQVIFGLTLDWEGVLGDHLGVVPARTVHRTLQKAASFFKRTTSDLAADTHDYLLDETKWVITPREQQQFIDEVTQLQYAADRLEARIKHLQREELS